MTSFVNTVLQSPPVSPAAIAASYIGHHDALWITIEISLLTVMWSSAITFWILLPKVGRRMLHRWSLGGFFLALQVGDLGAET